MNEGVDPAPSSDPTPPTSGFGAQAYQAGGQLCEWKDLASDATLTVVVAKPADVQAAEQRVSAGSQDVSSAFGEGSDQVYLASSGGTSSGDYSAFAGEGYWISMSSPLPEDQANAKTILEDILQALPSG